MKRGVLRHEAQLEGRVARLKELALVQLSKTIAMLLSSCVNIFFCQIFFKKKRAPTWSGRSLSCCSHSDFGIDNQNRGCSCRTFQTGSGHLAVRSLGRSISPRCLAVCVGRILSFVFVHLSQGEGVRPKRD